NVPQSVVESIIEQGFPALAKTTTPIPASVFSYRFASTNNQTPYYISSDIVLSGGIAQQTRRRIVHNEVERRRKDKINSWITKLADVIPKCSYGKQSKNIVLENAVEYVGELNDKIKMLEESQHGKNVLELESQALKTQVTLLQEQNAKLIELLEKNKVQVPESLAIVPQQNNNLNPSLLQTSKLDAPTIISESDNTYVTWSTSGIIPTTATSLVGSTVMNQPIGEAEVITSSNMCTEGLTRSIPQSQPNYSVYTVSSIMNGLSQTTPAPVTITVPVEADSTSIIDPPTAIPVVVIPTLGAQTLGSLVTTQNINQVGGTRIAVVKGHQTIEGTFESSQGYTPGIVPVVQETSVPQGVTQVVLCQRTVPQSSGPQGPPLINVPQGPLLTPIVTPNAVSVSRSYIAGPTALSNNTGLVIQSQAPIMTLGTPSSSTPALAIAINRTTALLGKGFVNTAIAQRNTSIQQAPGSITVINTPIAPIPTLTANPPGVINGGPVTMTIGQPASGTNSVRVIPVATMTNNFTSSLNPNPVPMATQVVTPGLVSVNVPTVPIRVGTGIVGSITTQQPGFVTLKLPKTTMQPVSNTPMTTNLLNTGATPTVNLTPSPGTAFVIVRSAPSQQAVSYPALQTHSMSQSSNFNCINVASTKLTPSTIIQPTILQNQPHTGAIQAPFTIIPSSNPAPVLNAVVGTTKRNHVLTMAESKSGSSQPPTKVPRKGNAKKRQLNRSSSSSKTKASKQQKTSQFSVVSSSAPISSALVYVARDDGSRDAQRSSSNVDICHDDMLAIQNFSISSLIPSIDSQNSASNTTKNSSPLTNGITYSNDTRTQGGSTTRMKTSQNSTGLRLSHSIDSLTGRSDGLRQEQTVVQQQPQNILSFSAESLLGSGDDLVSSLQPISCANASNNTFTPQNTLNISAFQDTSGDGSINQSFSNFSTEALISETDLIGISSDVQSSRSNFTQGAQNGKTAPNRTQMFSDFSAESLINSSDLGSGLSYAIDNLISRSDNSDNSIAMTSVNPNLLHSTTSNLLQDNMNHSMFTHSTAVPVVNNFSLSVNNDFQNASNTNSDSVNLAFSKYGFTSPQKQPKEIFAYKPNGAVTYSAMTTSPTYLKHSVDSITASQHNAVSSGGAVFGSTLGNALAAPSFNTLYSLEQVNPQQYQVGGNPFTLSSNLNRTSFQGPTMGSFA
ncbi:hypothetical protein QZH41_018574, partial [Actinostola sp. cb2023]